MDSNVTLQLFARPSHQNMSSNRNLRQETDYESSSSSFSSSELEDENICPPKDSNMNNFTEDTSPEEIMSLLDIPESGPYNVISVSGGTEKKNASFDKKMEERLLHDFKKIFHSEYRTLVITSGRDRGVIKIFNEVLKSMQWRERRRMKWLEIRPGMITDQQEEQSKPTDLDEHRRRVLLVRPRDGDPGYRHGTWFRGQFEHKMCKLASTGRSIVLLAVGGGIKTITEVANAVTHDNPIPVVLFKGSGGATDFIVDICEVQLTHSGDINEDDKEWMKEQFIETTIPDDLWQDISQIIQKSRLIQVYDPNVSSENVENGVHEAITNARIESELYRGKSETRACTLRMVVTLKDVISRMSDSESMAKKKEFQETLRMIEALRNEEMEFLEKGFSLQKHLDQTILDNDLYKMDKDNGDDDEDWPHPLDEKLKKIIDTYYKPQYKKTIATPSSQNNNMSVDASQNGPSYRDLFLWAIQTKRFDLADFAFEKLTDPIMTSLVVSYALKTVAEKLPQREHMKKEEYSALSREYEVKGEKIVAIAYSQSRSDANGLLRDPHKDWRKFTCLDMAIKAKAKIFLSNDCCQDTLRKMWFGKINHNEGSVKVYTGIPVYWAIAYTKWIQIDNKKKTETSASARGQGCMNYFSNCKAFYGAPVTKFGMHIVSYVMFLMLYAYVMIFCPLGDHLDLTDVLLHVWILTIFMEITRQMFSLYRHGHAFRRVDHFLEWKGTSRNKLSMITIVTLIAAFCCRWFDKTLLASRFLYGVNYFLFTIRALRLYTGSKTLGPMVSMIKHMFFRTLEFMAIFIIFVIGYGVAVQGFLARHSGESLSFGVFVDVFYRPYFQTFGELFIEDLPGAADDDVDPRTAITTLYTILLAIYLFLGNVLLLNLLIAIFSRDVERVQAESLELWKFESYVLHQEFARKPILPPPLSPIVYLYWLIKYIVRKCRKCCCKNKVSPAKKQQSERLRRFHKACLKHYLSNEKDKLHNSIDARTKRLETASEELQVQNKKIVEKASKIGDSTIGIGNRTRRIKKRTANIKEDTAQLVIRQEDVAGKMEWLEQHIEEWESDGRKISALVERQQDDVGELKNRLIDDYFATLSPRIEEMNQMLVSINKRFQDDSNNDSDAQNGNDSQSQLHPDATGDDGSAIKEIQESLNVVHSFLQRIEQSLETRAPRRHLSGADSGLAESQSFSSNLYENIAEDPSIRPQSETPDGKSLLDSGHHGRVEDAPHVMRMETTDDKSPIDGDRHVDIPDGMRSESPDGKSKISSSNLVSLVVEDAEPRTSTPIKGRAMTRRKLEDDFARVANNVTTNDPENHDRDNRGRAVAGDKMTPNSDVISNPVVETARSVTKRQHGGDNRNEQKKQRQKLYRADSLSSTSSDSEELSRQRNSKRRPRPAIRKRKTNRNLDTVDITPALRQRMKSSPILASIHYYWGIGLSGNIEMIGRVKSAPRMNQFSEHYSKY